MSRAYTALKWFTIGIVLSILFAPRSGRETRSILLSRLRMPGTAFQVNDTHVISNPPENTQQANTSEKRDHRNITRDPLAEIEDKAQSAQEQLEKQVRDNVSQAIDQATDETQGEVEATLEESRRIIKTEEDSIQEKQENIRSQLNQMPRLKDDHDEQS